MGVPLVIRASAFLLVLLVVLDPALGRSMSHGDEGEDIRQRRLRHISQPGSQLQDPVRYDLGSPETAVKTAGPQVDHPAPQNPLPSAKWEVISQAAQNIGRAVSLFQAKPGTFVNHHVKDVPHDDDDDDEDDDDDDNDDDDSDDDDVHSLKEPHDQVDLEDRGDDVDTASSHHDVYSDEEILKITGTPSPALITSEEDEQLIPETHVSEQLMRDDSAAAEQLLRTEGAQPKKAFKPVRMPTRFESYDLEPKDGFVTLQELINITGAKVNVHKAFNASDKNGDGLLDRREFYSAPWKLGPNWRYIPINPDEDNSSHEEDEEEDDEEYDEDDYDDDDMDDYDDDEWDEWDKWEDEDSDPWDDMDDVDIF